MGRSFHSPQTVASLEIVAGQGYAEATSNCRQGSLESSACGESRWRQTTARRIGSLQGRMRRWKTIGETIDDWRYPRVCTMRKFILNFQSIKPGMKRGHEISKLVESWREKWYLKGHRCSLMSESPNYATTSQQWLTLDLGRERKLGEDE